MSKIHPARRNYLTVEEAAERLGVTARTLHRYIKAGRLEINQNVPRGLLRISPDSVNKLSVRTRTANKACTSRHGGSNAGPEHEVSQR